MESPPLETPSEAYRAASSSTLRLGAILYTAFVVLGCLVPLDFRPLPWEEAWSRFQPVASLQPGPFSRADLVANVLLFTPLAFLWAGAMGAPRRRARAAVPLAGVWLGATAFQAALEFAQVYLPPRSVSLWDVIAGGVGAAAGILAWLLLGGRARVWIDRWNAVSGRDGIAGWMLAPYALFLLVYSVIPLDFTLRPASLYEKWKGGLIRPLPFAMLGNDAVSVALVLGTDVLLWLPLALLLVLSGRTGRFVGWCATVVAAVTVEICQLLLQSRVSSTTDALCAAAGAAVGVGLGGRWRLARGLETSVRDSAGARAFWGASVFAALWTGILLIGFLYPFDFRYDPGAIPLRLERLKELPFRSVSLLGDTRGAAALLRNLALYAPLGLAVAFAIRTVRGKRVAPAAAAAAAIGPALVAAGVELLQVFQPGKTPDSTAIVVAALGGLAGFYAGRAIVRGRAGGG